MGPNNGGRKHHTGLAKPLPAAKMLESRDIRKAVPDGERMSQEKKNKRKSRRKKEIQITPRPLGGRDQKKANRDRPERKARRETPKGKIK